MKRVLIVDDATTIRMFHRQIIENLGGVLIDEAMNGIEALEKSLQEPFDLYLVDINMPKMDGYTFVRQMRANPAIKVAPVIMISTEAEKRDINQAYLAGANFYMVKPIQPSRLANCVRILLA